ncbi:MAG TPA: hypothetical protein VEQ34_07370, partial [Pyrinomonadaceae bacterium]|nr:hypothetical protein [Pyrinomonadaceae bacterium]
GWINFGFNAVRGANLARSVLGLRWSGVRSRIGNFDLTSLATNAARNYVSDQIRTYGIASRIGNLNAIRNSNRQIIPNYPRPTVTLSAPSREDIQERLLDRLDPANLANRLADYLSRRKRLAELRGNFMYFYTELPGGGKGLVGVNVTNGDPQRQIRLNEPDARFVTDEVAGLLYSANGNRLTAYNLLAGR